MKRTLTAFTAAIFAGTLAVPAFAQVGDSNPPPSSLISTSSTSDSTRTDYRSEQPAQTTNSVERTEREYRSERTEQAAPMPEEAQSRIEHKETTRTTTEAVPPPPVESSTTTTTTRRTESGY
jgi:hypothetical protein